MISRVRPGSSAPLRNRRTGRRTRRAVTAALTAAGLVAALAGFAPASAAAGQHPQRRPGLHRQATTYATAVPAAASSTGGSGNPNTPHTYPAGGPDDPAYAPLERLYAKEGPAACAQNDINNEEHYFYSFNPPCAPRAKAHDPGGAAGMSIDKAWHDYTTGDPRVVMAYIEGGINWFDPAVRDLVDNVYLNWKELPIPCDGATVATARMVLHGHTTSCRPAWSANPRAYNVLPTGPGGSAQVVNSDGAVNVSDYAHDPRVHDANHNGFLDAEDLIVAFSCFDRFNHTIGRASWPGGKLHCSNGAAKVDNDGDGFPHDISGWDFYDHQNDPATYDSTYDHSDDQMLQADAVGNNGLGGVGLCPTCMVMPIKAGAEALDRTDDLAQAWLYACHVGVKVIISVTADLGYSSYMNQAIRYCWRHNVVMVEASNDFDSIDHQGGMFHEFVLPGNGEVPNTYGYDTVGTPASYAVTNADTTTFATRSDETSWGTHNMFSAATQGGSTSESTPTVGGAFGLLLSWGIQAAAKGLISHPLTADEAIQVMRATASKITDPTLPWPGSPGDWNMQYGYGRPNLYAAMKAVARDDIPPVAWFTGPAWYALYDPTRTYAVTISGHVAAPRSGRYTWRLQYGLGPQPTRWSTISRGSGRHAYTGRLGTLDLSRIPRSFWTAAFRLSKTKELATNDQYTVTLRLRVSDAAGRMGEDRRAIAVEHDRTELRGFPLSLKPEGGRSPGVPGMTIDGASQPVMVDLQGTGRLALVYADSDGWVHAIDPKTRKELPGWPVSTNRTVPQHGYPGIDPGHEPILAPIAVGDLFHTGRLDVVATTTTGRVYIWNANGKRLAGWPKALSLDAVTPPVPRPKDDFTRLPHLGATASPVLVSMTGSKQLDIVQAGWDGDVFAWTPAGRALPGWPVHVDGNLLTPPSGYVKINDHKIDTTPAVAYLDGSKRPDIVVQSQYDFTRGAGIQELGYGNAFAYSSTGKLLSGWPVSLPAFVVYYGSAQEFITEGSTPPVVANTSGSGDEVALSPGIFSPTYLVNGAGQKTAVYGPVSNPFAPFLSGTFDPTQLGKGKLPADTPVTFTTTGAFGRLTSGGRLGFFQPGSGAVSVAVALLLNGSGYPIDNDIRGYDAATGSVLPGFPATLQGLDFLGSPLVAPVSGTAGSSVVDSADSSALEAVGGTGSEPAGFPKFTTGWVLFSPSAGDLLSTGHVDVAAATREGYLMAWATPGSAAANTQWWTYHGDEWRQGRYGVDSRPPGTLRHVHWRPGERTASFVAPGNNWYAGSVAGYYVDIDGRTHIAAAQGAAGSVERLHIPAGARRVVVQPFDSAGNLGPAISLAAANGKAAAGEGLPGGVPAGTGRGPANTAAGSSTGLPDTGAAPAPGLLGLAAGLLLTAAWTVRRLRSRATA